LTLGTFAAGLLGHIAIFAAGPWLSLKTQAAIHAAIPVILTAVKFVTLPLLLSIGVQSEPRIGVQKGPL
jgi:hypothetical protein